MAYLRRVDRQELFREEGDYRAFENVLSEAAVSEGMRVCSYCLMPNHWHLALWPCRDGALSNFMHRVTGTHAARWKEHKDSWGTGHLYQNRFKSFPVQSDEHYLTLVRYVERNALRANLVVRAEEWRFSSLWQRDARMAAGDPLVTEGPLELPNNWVERVNRPQNKAELEALRLSVRRGRPFGTTSWQTETARALDLESTLRNPGRPKKTPAE